MIFCESQSPSPFPTCDASTATFIKLPKCKTYLHQCCLSLFCSTETCHWQTKSNYIHVIHLITLEECYFDLGRPRDKQQCATRHQCADRHKRAVPKARSRSYDMIHMIHIYFILFRSAITTASVYPSSWCGALSMPRSNTVFEMESQSQPTNTTRLLFGCWMAR